MFFNLWTKEDIEIFFKLKIVRELEESPHTYSLDFYESGLCTYIDYLNE